VEEGRAKWANRLALVDALAGEGVVGPRRPAAVAAVVAAAARAEARQRWVSSLQALVPRVLPEKRAQTM
jgi:hypothetical protein